MRVEMNNLKANIVQTESALNGMSTETEEASDDMKDLGAETKTAGNEATQASNGGFTVMKGVLADLASSAIKSAVNGLKSLGSTLINVGKDAITSYADYEQLVGGVETLFGAQGMSLKEYAKSVGKDADDVKDEYYNLLTAQSNVLSNASNAYKTAGLSQNQYIETVTGFSASLINSLGGDTLKASKYADMAVTDMADNANKMGTDIGSIQNAYQGFAKQNYTMLDNLKLGYGGTQKEMYRLLQDASKIDSAFASNAKFSMDSKGHLEADYADIVEAIHIVQNEMGITGTTSKEASNTISGSLNSAKSAWSNLITGIADDNADFDTLINNFVNSVVTAGQNLIPRIQTTIQGMAKMVTQLLQKLVPQIIKTLPPLIKSTLPQLLTAVNSVITSLLAVLPDVVKEVSALIPDIVSSLISLAPQLLKAGIVILTELLKGINSAIPQLMAMLPTLINDIVNVLSQNAPALLQAGISILVAVIQGITSALPQLVAMIPDIIQTAITTLSQGKSDLLSAGVTILQTLIDGIIQFIPAFVKMLPKVITAIVNYFKSGENIKTIIKVGSDILLTLADGISKAISMLAPKIKEIVSALKEGFKEKWETIKGMGKTIIEKLIAGLASMIVDIKTKAGEIGTKIKEKLEEFPEKIKTVGKDIITGLWNGIHDKIAWLKEKIASLGSTVLNKIKDIFDIHSPSRVFKNEIGKNLALGLGEGFTEEMKNVTSAMEDSVPTTLNTSLSASGNPLATTGGMDSMPLVDSLVEALGSMKIEMGEDGFAHFVVKTITDEIYQ